MKTGRSSRTVATWLTAVILAVVLGCRRETPPDSVRSTTRAKPPAAQAGKAVATDLQDRLKFAITVSPRSVRAGDSFSVSYDVDNALSEEVRVSGIRTDSLYPLMPGNPAWVTGRFSPGAKGTVARQTIARASPPGYAFRAQFVTNLGEFAAVPLTIIVPAGFQPQDTGHVQARISVWPNPCSVGATCIVDYQVSNTTNQDFVVEAIETESGTLKPGSPGWLTSKVGARMTIVVARIRDRQTRAGPRDLTAAFRVGSDWRFAQPVTLEVR